jgi:hypothetical protein
MCKLQAKLRLTNNTDQQITSTSISVYISGDSSFDSSDQLLQQRTIKAVSVGKFKQLIIKQAIAADALTTGSYLIAVINPDQPLDTACDQFNRVAVGQISSP